MTTPATKTKIVIVAGQEFSVPAETENEAIKAQLLAMGFADVASATIQKGTRDGIETIEFVKKAGTKGLDGADLAALLGRVPPIAPPAIGGLNAAQAAQIERLSTYALTVGELLDPAVEQALAVCRDRYASSNETQERALCTTVDTIPAVASPVALGW